MGKYREFAIDLVKEEVVSPLNFSIMLLRYLSESQIEDFLNVNGLLPENENE